MKLIRAQLRIKYTNSKIIRRHLDVCSRRGFMFQSPFTHSIIEKSEYEREEKRALMATTTEKENM